MQYLTRWKPTLGIILTALIVCLCAVPNFFPEATVKSWPLWAQRRMVLGLDLQGGSYLLLEVDSKDVKRSRLGQIREDVQRTLRTARILYNDLAVKGDAVEVRIRNNTDLANALSKLRDLSQPLGGLLGSTSQRDLDVTDAGNGLIRLTIPEAAVNDRLRKTIEQSIQIVEKRVNELGTVEPLIQRQGNDRILVQVPGLQDPTHLKELLGKTAKMDFRMVDEQRADRIRPTQQRARGQFPVQYRGLAQIRTSHHRRRRAAVRDRAG
jgi:preprotein translocase subunit SecD